MNTQSYTSPKTDFKQQWLRTSDLIFTEENEQPSVIFIGSTNAANRTNFANLKFISEDFSEAKKHLLILNDNASNNTCKVIIIDIPLSIAALEKFSAFVKKESNAIIIYSKEKLTYNEAKFLKAFDLVNAVSILECKNLEQAVRKSITKNLKSNQKKLYNKTKQLHVKGKEKAKNFSFLLKKIFDISSAALIIICLLPVFILICIAIKLDSKGPVFYSSLRTGRGYKIFKFYKFRSMIVGADKKIEDLAHLNQYSLCKDGPTFFKLNDDPRVTRVGKFLRNTSLDELPQLFNILLGDMSLVGNRPLPLYEAATLTTNEFVERFSAPAGMTGFWQIKKRGKAEMSVKERVDLDIVYARKASPIFDLYIMANTPAALFQKSSV